MSSSIEFDQRADLFRHIEVMCLLDDPVRRRVYFQVPSAPSHADRDAIAATLGISRSLAAFHLDKLAQPGLLDVTFRRVGIKTGRGAGRPRKLYQRSREDQIDVSIPQRDYRLIAALFASALESSGRGPHSKLATAAYQRGMELAKTSMESGESMRSRRGSLSAVLGTLARHGYDPQLKGANIYMQNCPFHVLAEHHRDLVCGANQAVMKGFVETLESASLAAAYEPSENHCCVVLHAKEAAG